MIKVSSVYNDHSYLIYRQNHVRKCIENDCLIRIIEIDYFQQYKN